MEARLQGAGPEPDMEELGEIGQDLQAQESDLIEKLGRIESLREQAERLKAKLKASQEELARAAQDKKAQILEAQVKATQEKSARAAEDKGFQKNREQIRNYQAEILKMPEARQRGIRKGINVIYNDLAGGKQSKRVLVLTRTYY